MSKGLGVVFIVLVVIALADSAETASIQAEMPPAAVEILARMDKEIAVARTKALRDLDKVLKDTTKKGDLPGALAVKESMDRLVTDISAPRLAIGAALAGKWQTPTGMFELLSDGTAKSGEINGKWSSDGMNFKLDWSTGYRYEMKVTPAGLSGVRVTPTGERTASSWTRIR